jgi:hypothetical protein
MKHNINRLFTVLGVLALFLVVGCATTQLGKRVQTLATWNDMLESYKYQYSVADQVTKAVWKAEVWPIVKKANDAYLTLDKALDAGTGIEEKRQAFLKLERKVIDLFLRYGIKRPEN